jgi:hypothetical protein
MAAGNAFGESFVSEMFSEFGLSRCEELGGMSVEGRDLVRDACRPNSMAAV